MPLNSDIGNILNPLLASFDDSLTVTLEGQLTEIYVSGQAEMVSYGKTKLGLPVTYEGPPIQKAIDWAKGHVSKAKLVDGLNEETRKQISNIIADGIKNKRGIPGIKSDIRHKLDWMARGAPSEIKGLTLASRAEMIARTETANALSQASLNTMEDMGVDGKEWITVGDDQVSDECLANEEQGIIPVGETFVSGAMAPPQHPDAVFEGYEFYPYGSLLQMLSSRYDGPSITIEVERIEDIAELPSGDTASLPDSPGRDIIVEHSDSRGDLLIRNRSGKAIAIFPKRANLTIGPNHPILTRRGFVNTQFLNEGDELLYDGWCELSAWFAKPNFKQVHLVEDVFEAVASVVGYTDIPTPGDYFHGDEASCYGEIKVVRPDWDLLPVSDTGAIEHLSKCNLTGAYTNAEHVAGCSTCQSAFNSVFASTPSGMSSSSHIEPFLRGVTSPSFFHSYRLIRIHKTSFSGLAFDASTSTELYNIGGLVVKNCRCAVAPARLPK